MSRDRVSALFTWRSFLTERTPENTLTTTERAVGLLLSTFMNEQGDSAYPSVPTLAAGLACSERAVQKAIAGLVEKGALEVKRNAGPKGPTGRPNRYLARFERSSATPPSRGEPDSPPARGERAEGVNETTSRGEPGSPYHATTTPKVESTNVDSPRAERSSTGKAAEKDALVEALCRVLATPLEELPRSRRKRYGQVAWELLEVGATPETLEDRAARWGDFWDGRKLNLTVDSIVKWWADLGAEERSKAAGGGPTPDARFRSMLKWAGGRGSATFPEEEDFLSVLQSSYKDLPDEAHQEALEAYRNAKRSAA